MAITIAKKKLFKKIAWSIVAIFIVMNVVAFFHAWKFTHFSDSSDAKTKSKDLSAAEKIKALLLGINNPRPVNQSKPDRAYEPITIQSNKKIECWLIKADSAKGAVVLFHGYGGEKSSMLDKAVQFLKAGYSTLLVDFMGSGGSEGNQTTIGYKEAQQVKSCYNYLLGKGEKKIFLFGTSLGAAAILKAIHDYNINPRGIIIECPFSTLYQTTCARFKSLKIPSFPMASFLVFWGGLQNGFWGFSFKPVAYAKAVNCPVLFFYGEKDEKVSRDETNAIYNNLTGDKKLVIFPEAGHENYLIKYENEWSFETKQFLEANR